MRYLTLAETLWLHDRILSTSGGGAGLRDLGRVEAVLAQPVATFDGEYLYADLAAKATALCFGLVLGHAFIDGNKRIGHAAMELFLLLNGARLEASVDDQERVILALAGSNLSREQLDQWIRAHISAVPPKVPKAQPT